MSPVLRYSAKVYRYLGFRTMVYLSPYLGNKNSFWPLALYALAGRSQRNPPRWRVCLHLVNKLLPSLLVATFQTVLEKAPNFQGIMVGTILFLDAGSIEGYYVAS